MKVMTLGSFDTPHFGHANLLRRCRELSGDANTVYIGLNSDEFVEKYKGKKPIMSFDERQEGLFAFGNATVAKNDGPGIELIEWYEPELIVIGSDWARKDYLAQIGVTQDWLDARNISIAYVPYTEGVSTTELKARINAS